MDLNYLYHRQQVSLARADRAQCPASRAAHRGLAHGYEAQIRELRLSRAGGRTA